MRNEIGESRGFGFVSYQTPDQGSHVPTCSKKYLLKCSVSFRCDAWYERRSRGLETPGRPLA